MLATAAPPPVILLNGLAGSVVNARLDHLAEAPHVYCTRDSKGTFDQLWVSVDELVPGVIDCNFDNLRLHYNASTKAYANKPGVTIDASVDWGGVGGLDFLDAKLHVGGYFHSLIRHLEATLGYKVGLSLRGAPYDWRQAPDGFSTVDAGAAYKGGSYFDRLRQLVEETRKLNGQRRVVLVTHSMGGPTAYAFLRTMSAPWKATHIAALIALSPPFGGALSTMKALVSGDTLGIPLITHSLFHPIQSTCASGPWLFPQPALWPAHEVLITSAAPSANASAATSTASSVGSANSTMLKWTSSNYTELAQALGLKQAAALFAGGVGALLANFAPPGVAVEVLRGGGVPTPAAFRYAEAFTPGIVPAEPATITEADGDGTVNSRSLERAAAWRTQQSQPVRYWHFANTSHFGVLTSNPVLNRLTALLTNFTDERQDTV